MSGPIVPLQQKLLERIISPFYFNQFQILFPEAPLLDDRVNQLSALFSKRPELEESFRTYTSTIQKTEYPRTLVELIRFINTSQTRNWLIGTEWSTRLKIKDLTLDEKTGRISKPISEIFKIASRIESENQDHPGLVNELLPVALAFDYLKIIQKSPLFNPEKALRLDDLIEQRFQVAHQQAKLFQTALQDHPEMPLAKAAGKIFYLRQLAILSICFLESEFVELQKRFDKDRLPELARMMTVYQQYKITLGEWMAHWATAIPGTGPALIGCALWGANDVIDSKDHDAFSLAWVIVEQIENKPLSNSTDSREQFVKFFPNHSKKAIWTSETIRKVVAA